MSVVIVIVVVVIVAVFCPAIGDHELIKNKIVIVAVVTLVTSQLFILFRFNQRMQQPITIQDLCGDNQIVSSS